MSLKGFLTVQFMFWKVIDIKHSGFGKHWLSQISLFKVDIFPLVHTKYLSIAHSSYTPRVQTRSLYPSLITPVTAACVNYSSSLSRLSSLVVSLYICDQAWETGLIYT